MNALSLDPALGKRERAKGCNAAFVYSALDRRGVLWVEAWLSREWDGNALARRGVNLCRELQPKGLLYEANQGQAFLGPLLDMAARSRGFVLPLYQIVNTENKEERIRAGLTPRLARPEFRFRDTPGTQRLVRQLRDFSVGGPASWTGRTRSS
jgi:hypothetical protein